MESDDEDSDLNAAYQAREESDGDEADTSVSGVKMTLRSSGEALQTIFAEKSGFSAYAPVYLCNGGAGEGDGGNDSARTHRSDLHD